MLWRTLNYTLTDEQMNDAKKIGFDRCNAKDPDIRSNDSDYHDGDLGREFPHEMGAIAEVAFSAITGMKINRELHSRSGDECDFGLIELKSASHIGDDIYLKVKMEEFDKKKTPQAYVLARVTGNLVQFIGAIRRKKFEKVGFRRIFKSGGPLNFCATRSSLDLCLPYYDSDGKFMKISF